MLTLWQSVKSIGELCISVIKQNLIIILLIMVSMYNINSEIESLNENIIRIMGTIEDNINDIKPILKENWHGVRMGKWHISIIYF